MTNLEKGIIMKKFMVAFAMFVTIMSVGMIGSGKAYAADYKVKESKSISVETVEERIMLQVLSEDFVWWIENYPTDEDIELMSLDINRDGDVYYIDAEYFVNGEYHDGYLGKFYRDELVDVYVNMVRLIAQAKLGVWE